MDSPFHGIKLFWLECVMYSFFAISLHTAPRASWHWKNKVWGCFFLAIETYFRSLCRGLAQQLALRCRPHIKTVMFVELQSHALFSKWFSESGKLITQLFSRIRHVLAEDHSVFMVLVIDEVETLTVARRTSLSGNEPSDAVRAVNALLTQLDSLRNAPNLLVLATTNLAGEIICKIVDPAHTIYKCKPSNQPANQPTIDRS
jgi:hypothetical protein